MKWIRVEDKLPEMITGECYSEDILAFCVSHGNSTEFGSPNTYEKGETYMSIDRLVKWNDKEYSSFRSDRYYGKVTHWMPLPEFPTIFVDKEEG